MKPLLAITGLLLAIATAVALLDAGTSEPPTTPPGSSERTGELRPVPGSQLADEEINRQDPSDPEREDREARAFDQRPLLNALPITFRGVTFDIGGLAADGSTTIIHADHRGLGRRRARIAFETLRHQTGDRSDVYRLELRP